MYLEGNAPFSGALRAYFSDGTIRVMVPARDIAAGEQILPDKVTFLPIEEANLVAKAVPPHLVTDLDAPIRILEDLIQRKENHENERGISCGNAEKNK